MPFINVGANLGDIPEEAAVPEGEYDLCVVSVGDLKESKTSDRMVMNVGHRIEDPDYPDAALAFHNLVFPSKEDFDEDPKKATLLLRNIKRYLAVFGVQWGEGGFDSEDLEGQKGTCFLGQEEYEGNVKNVLKPPRMKE